MQADTEDHGLVRGHDASERGMISGASRRQQIVDFTFFFQVPPMKTDTNAKGKRMQKKRAISGSAKG
jgi:hypothetical protein